MLLADFTASFEPWTPIGDVIMGGVSESAFTPSPGRGARFHGTLLPGASGGFASVRSPLGEFDCGADAGIEILARGDGRRYKLSLRTARAPDGIQYQASFAASAEEWARVRIPFAQFQPVFRGRPVPDAPPLDHRQIVSLGFVVADGQAGSFLLEIEKISSFA